jgi:1-acyl-sn-glycerol-3-phosphate acyltransferase
VRLILVPPPRLLQARALRPQHGKIRGPLIVAANHRSFLDPFVIGPRCRGAAAPLRREGRALREALAGWILSRLGAYPVRRGQSDEQTLITSREVLKREANLHLPEGTRHRTGSLARPKRGFGRLALESGAAVLPVAVHGTEYVRNGWRIRPRKVKIRAGRALTFPRTENPSPTLANSVGARIWPVIELQWEWLGGLPPLRKAAVIGAGAGGQPSRPARPGRARYSSAPVRPSGPRR